MSEIVYLFTNPVFPDHIKIGRSTNLEARMRSLSSHSGVPVPFECDYACEAKNSADTEKRLHLAFGDHRINPKREFFPISPERVKIILEALALEDLTPTTDIVEDEQEREILKIVWSLRPPFRFSMVEIDTGSELTFLKDKAINFIIHGDCQIEFQGQRSSLKKSLPKFWIPSLVRTGNRCEDQISGFLRMKL